MKIACLGSSSKGNCVFIRSGETRILIDSGLSCKKTVARLKRLGEDIKEIEAIVLTHGHEDHCKTAAPLSRRYGIPIRANSKTWNFAKGKNYIASSKGVKYRKFDTGRPFLIGALRIRSYRASHDAWGTVCFSISDMRHSVGYITDAGEITKEMTKALKKRDFLIIESNYDEDMIRNSQIQ